MVIMTFTFNKERITAKIMPRHNLFMKNAAFQKMISFSLIMVVIAAATAGFWQDARAEELALAKSSKSSHSAFHAIPSIKTNTKSPDNQNTGDNDTCGSCRYCACHAPLLHQPIQLTYFPQYNLLQPTGESFEVPSEVYLSIFIPPQNLA